MNIDEKKKHLKQEFLITFRIYSELQEQLKDTKTNLDRIEGKILLCDEILNEV